MPHSRIMSVRAQRQLFTTRYLKRLRAAIQASEQNKQALLERIEEIDRQRKDLNLEIDRQKASKAKQEAERETNAQRKRRERSPPRRREQSPVRTNRFDQGDPRKRSHVMPDERRWDDRRREDRRRRSPRRDERRYSPRRPDRSPRRTVSRRPSDLPPLPDRPPPPAPD
ncbi:MAG: hypothetical protein KVP17_005043 [Porospora cf. gigantea B]|uniref:uncharacterized protein n=1 Tax=Porospora cf. gigantea B TaxID=2853592 RepID=UPI003571A7A9|nr:MAG: hypothetical protein KVP17_005043 [Porospora cf. gigantea B]